MAKVYKSSVINAPVDKVWAYIRDFNELPKWVGPISASEIEDGRASDSIGCVRKLTLDNGAVVREQLLTLSDHDHQCTYSIIEAPLPLSDYVSTVKLSPVTDGERTFAEWTGEFETDQLQEMTDLIGNGVYQSGFDALKQQFGG